MTTPHDTAPHDTANQFKSLMDQALRAQVENLPPRAMRSPSFGKIDQASPRPGQRAMRPAQIIATMAGGEAFPRSGVHPPIQGQAFSHRLPFLHRAQAGSEGARRVRTAATSTGAGLGYGGCAG